MLSRETLARIQWNQVLSNHMIKLPLKSLLAVMRGDPASGADPPILICFFVLISSITNFFQSNCFCRLIAVLFLPSFQKPSVPRKNLVGGYYIQRLQVPSITKFWLDCSGILKPNRMQLEYTSLLVQSRVALRLQADKLPVKGWVVERSRQQHQPRSL